MNEFQPQIAAQMARWYSVLIVFSIITLILLYSGFPFFGPVNDLTNAISGLVLLALAWNVHSVLGKHWGGLATLFLSAAALGAFSIAGNSIMVAFGKLGWQTGGMYTALGYGLVGIWLLGAIPALEATLSLTPNLILLGRWAALTMTIGLLGILPILSLVALSSPVAYVAMAAIAVGWLLFPFWTFRFSQFLQ